MRSQPSHRRRVRCRDGVQGRGGCRGGAGCEGASVPRPASVKVTCSTDVQCEYAQHRRLQEAGQTAESSLRYRPALVTAHRRHAVLVGAAHAQLEAGVPESWRRKRNTHWPNDEIVRTDSSAETSLASTVNKARSHIRSQASHLCTPVRTTKQMKHRADKKYETAFASPCDQIT